MRRTPLRRELEARRGARRDRRAVRRWLLVLCWRSQGSMFRAPAETVKTSTCREPRLTDRNIRWPCCSNPCSSIPHGSCRRDAMWDFAGARRNARCLSGSTRRAERTEPRRPDRHQRDRDHQLAHRQTNTNHAHETLRHPKLHRRPTRSREIGKLRHTSEKEHTRQQNPRREKRRPHRARHHMPADSELQATNSRCWQLAARQLSRRALVPGHAWIRPTRVRALRRPATNPQHLQMPRRVRGRRHRLTNPRARPDSQHQPLIRQPQEVPSRPCVAQQPTLHHGSKRRARTGKWCRSHSHLLPTLWAA
jgi:hypothetical protein